MKKSIVLITSVLLFFLVVKTNANQPSGDEQLQQLTIRQILATYFPNGVFYFGASSQKEYWTNPSEISNFYFNEFSYNTPENSFKQATVYNNSGTAKDVWKSGEYQFFIKQARKHNQLLRAHGPISPQCNKWVREDNRTPAELDDMLSRFMTQLSKEVEANKDVVKWLDVVNETVTGSNQKGIGYFGEKTEDVVVYKPEDWFGPRKGIEAWENPWTKLGFEKVTANGQDFEIPKYIIKAFEIANKYAPGVKLIWNDHCRMDNANSYDKIKKSILYLRSKGLRVDGIGWQSHVELGWEKNANSIKNLENLIDWCYQNKLEFHITELDVMVSKQKGSETIDTIALESTRKEQAATYAAIVTTMLKKVNKGATAINVWTMTDHFHKGKTFAGLFDEKGNSNPAYFEVKKLLLHFGKQSK